MKGDPEGMYPGKRGSILIDDVLTRKGRTDIFIDNRGIIGAVGEGVSRRYRNEADLLLPGKDCIAIPGLVNTHTHAAMTLLRGYADDMPLGDWLSQKIWPLEANLTGEDVYWGTRLACLEMIKSGTIAFSDMYFFMDEAARAVAESGLRALESHSRHTGDLCRRSRHRRIAGHARRPRKAEGSAKLASIAGGNVAPTS